MTHLRPLSFALLPLLAASALAQLPAPTLLSRTAPRAAWTAVTSAGTTTPAGTPPTVPNFNTTFRADSTGVATNDKLYVFGGRLGNNTTTVTNDLWAFDAVAGTFTQLIPHGAVGSPAARARFCAAWNPTSNKIVVFGGHTGGATPVLLNDTWEYDITAGTWTDVTPVSGSPAPRQFASMAWDPTLGGMLLFGGQTNDATPNVNSNETWLFLAGAWTQLSPVTTPPARGQHSLVTRSDFGDCLMCGGIDNGIATPDQVRFLDVWTWNGVNWSLISNCDVLTNPTGAGTTWPGSANANQAVYDPLRKRVVVQGGQGITVAANTTYVYGPSYGGSPTNYTSEFDCLTNTWVLYANPTTGATPFNNNDPQIGRVSRYYGGFIPATGKVYKVCGQNAAASASKPAFNVYQYQATPVASTAPYGATCSGPGGPLALTADNAPWTERTFQATATGFGPLSLGFAIVSLGQVLPGLPLPLVPVPGPGVGCELGVASLDITAGLIPIAGTAQFFLSLPSAQVDPTLPGLDFYLQIAELDFSAGWVGTYTTNSLACEIGSL